MIGTNRGVQFSRHSNPNAVLVALLTETANIGAKVAVIGSIANAMVKGLLEADNKRAFIVYAPTKPLVYPAVARHLATIQHPLPHFCSLQIMHAMLATVTALTEDWVTSSGTAIQTVQLNTIVEGWRQLAETCHALIVLQQYDVENQPGVTVRQKHRSILSALHAVGMGLHPCVADDGSIYIPGWAERRRHARFGCCEPVTVHRSGRSDAAVLRDVSLAGLGLFELRYVEKGQRVTVELSDSRRFTGTVTNVIGERAGLFLDRPLDRDDPLVARFHDEGGHQCR